MNTNRATAVTPLVVIRVVLLFTLLQYYIVTVNPSVRSITTYYASILPSVSRFSETVLPMLFVASCLFLIGFFQHRPVLSILVGLVPQMLYMALSVGWYLGGNDVNYAACGIHVVVSLLFMTLVWIAQYDNGKYISTV